MGDTFALSLDDVIPLVDPPQQHVAEVNRPDPVVDLLEANRMLLERIGQEQQPLLLMKSPFSGSILPAAGFSRAGNGWSPTASSGLNG